MPHILIVDDEADLLEMVGYGLARYGLTTTCVTNTADFFPMLKVKPPDAILMDIYLGYADGREICRQIKCDSNYAQIPVILYSAGNISDESIKQSGADAFIAKPFGVQDLAEKLIELCRPDLTSNAGDNRVV
jgi:CheY-like chemotaxis protein